MKRCKYKRVTHKRRRNAKRGEKSSVSLAARFLRETFYYLKGEQFLKTSLRILCKAS